jgi:hypothetical protein
MAMGCRHHRVLPTRACGTATRPHSQGYCRRGASNVLVSNDLPERRLGPVTHQSRESSRRVWIGKLGPVNTSAFSREICSSDRPISSSAPRAASWCARMLAHWAAGRALTRIWSPPYLLEAHLRLRICLKGSRRKVFRLKSGGFRSVAYPFFVALTGPRTGKPPSLALRCPCGTTSNKFRIANSGFLSTRELLRSLSLW